MSPRNHIRALLLLIPLLVGCPDPQDDDSSSPTPGGTTYPDPDATPTLKPGETPSVTPTLKPGETPTPDPEHTATPLPGKDADKDGYPSSEDCDDRDPTVHPGADEICDGKDNNCDGSTDEGVGFTWYLDGDGDGYGTDENTVSACAAPKDYVSTAGDCNDEDALINPAATEVCDDVDNDCDGQADEAEALEAGLWYLDGDQDGHGAGTPVTACVPPAGYVASNDDCDDVAIDVHPGAPEHCNKRDDDCDGQVDEGEAVGGYEAWVDADGDGYGDPSKLVLSCSVVAGTVPNSDDCDDTNASINPKATEVCDSRDNNCDGQADNGATDVKPFYPDEDKDGYGATIDPVMACVQPVGFVSDDSDCNDKDADSNPDGIEVCDGQDNDCNGTADDNATDAATYYRDGDKDTYGLSSASVVTCVAPVGFVAKSGDCDDAHPEVYPGAEELCDGLDNDCNKLVDDNPPAGDEFATDADGDGFGAPGTTTLACEGARNELDCDDTNPDEPQVTSSAATGLEDGTLAHPWNTIQEGIDNANVCVMVMAGTYKEAISFKGKGIKVIGVAGMGSTLIDATGLAKPVVTFANAEDLDAELSGFTLLRGEGNLTTTSTSTSCGSNQTCYTYENTFCGGGIYLKKSTPNLHDLTLVQNILPAAGSKTVGSDTVKTWSYGGGICAIGATVVLTSIQIRSNFADQGGGIYVDDTSRVELRQSWLTSNTATDGAGIEVDGGTAILTNVVSSWNKASGKGGAVAVVSAGNLVATNITLGEDDASASGGVVYLAGSSTGKLTNSIVYGANTTYGVVVSSSTLTCTYDDVYGNAAGKYSGMVDPTGTNGNLSSNPLFTSVTDDANPFNDDWHLGKGSPAINTGDPATVYNDEDGSRNDMGAYGGPRSKWKY